MSKANSTVVLDCERMKYPYTGLFYYCLHLGQSLLKAEGFNHRLCFYTPPSAREAFGKAACYLPQHSLHKFRLPVKKDCRLWHSTYQGTNYFPRRKGLKVVLTVHDLNFMYDERKTEAKKRGYLQKLKEKVDRADHITAISHFTLEDLRRHIDIGNKPCSVIYNGCNIVEIKDVQAPSLLPTAPFFFTIGTIVEKKNFHVLPALLLNNQMQLVIAGITQSEAYKNRIVTEAQKLGVADRLVFTGSINENDKQWYLKNCAAFAFPSISEGFGLPVVEAMYFGKPLLLARATSLPEIGGEHALYFDNFEPGEINRIATKAIAEHTESKAQAIRQRANRFQWDEAARQYLALYEELLSQ